MSQTQLASMRLGTMFLGDDGDVVQVGNMQRVLIADGQTGEILDFIPFKYLLRDNRRWSLKDTLDIFEFSTFGDKRFSQFLEKKNRIIIQNDEGGLSEYVIFESHKYRDREGYKVDVFTRASFLDIKKANIIYPDKYTGTATQHVGRALNNTGYRVGVVESNASATIEFDNHSNPLAYLKRIATEFGLEIKFRIENNESHITARYVDLVEQVGEWRNRTVEFGKDLQEIRRIEKQDIYTALLGIGPEDENGNRLEVFVEDEEALQRWGRIDEFGELQHLVGVHEIQSARTEMTEAEAIQYTRTELNKRINTVVSYETTIVDLENVPGMQNKKIRDGDTIRIKDTHFNPPLYLEARIFESEGSIKQKENRKVILGDYIEYTEDQVNAIWNQLKGQIKNRITASELAEYTYNKITIDNKDNAVRSDVESYANTVSNDAKEEAIIYTNNTIEPIVVSVGNLSDSIGDIESDMSDYANQIAQAQTDITQAWDEIDLRATKTEVDLIESRVSTAESVLSVQAGKIEAKADSTVVDSLGTRISNAESSIDAIEGEITNKVSLTEFNALDDTVSNLQSTVTQQAGLIEQKVDDGQVRSIFTQEANSFTFQADQINFDGHVFGGNATFTGHLQGTTGTFSGEVTSQLSNTLNDYTAEMKEGQLTLSNHHKATAIRSNLILDGRGLFQSITDGLWQSAPLQIEGRYGVEIRSLAGLIGIRNDLEVSGGLTLRNVRSGGGRDNGIDFGTGNDRHTIGDFDGDFTIYGNRGVGRAFVVRSHDNSSNFRDDILLNPSGTLLLPNSNTTSDGANLNMSSTGAIQRSTSARKYKKDIEPIDLSNGYAYKILDVELKSWYDKLEIEENGGSIDGLNRYYGLIADEVHDLGLTKFVTYKEGEVDGLKYDRLWILLIPIVKKLVEDLRTSDMTVQLLKNELKIIKERIA